MPEAEDLFQDALIVVFEQLQQPYFTIKYDFYTYLFCVCKNQWLKHLRNSKKVNNAGEMAWAYLAHESTHEAEQLALMEQIYQRKVGLLCPGCQAVLKLAMCGRSIDEIARLLNLKSKRHASNRKSYCKQQLASLVQTDAQYLELYL